MAQKPPEQNINLVNPQKPITPTTAPIQPTAQPPQPNLQNVMPPQPPNIQPPQQTITTSQNQPIQPPQNFQQSQNQAPPPIPKRGGAKGLILGLILFFILITAFFAGTYLLAYTNYSLFTPPKAFRNAIDSVMMVTPLPKNPRMIMQKSFKEMAEVKTATQENTIQFEVEGEFPVKNVKFTAKGPVDFKNTDSKKSEADLTLSVETEGITFSGAASIKQIDKIFYFKITEMPAGSFIPVDNFKNQWFYIDLEEYEDETLTDAETEKIIQDITKIVQDFIAKSHDWTTLVDGNKNVHTLDIDPPKEEVSALIYEIIEIIEPVTQSALEEDIQRESLDEFLKYFDDFQLKLEIDKKTYRVTELSGSFVINIHSLGNFSQEEFGLPVSDSLTINTSFGAKFTDHDKTIVIDIPNDARDIVDYYNQFLTQYGFDQNPYTQENIPQEEIAPEQLEQNPEEIQLEENQAEEDSILHDALDSPSPVLGQKTNWDLILLKSLSVLFQ